MAATKPQMKLGMFYWPCGHHMAAWRHPDAFADSGSNIEHLVELAKLSERGLFDMFFMADSVSFWAGGLDAMTHEARGAWIEPFTLMCALAPHTKHSGSGLHHDIDLQPALLPGAAVCLPRSRQRRPRRLEFGDLRQQA